MKCNRILISTNSILLNQWYNVISSVFYNIPCIIVKDKLKNIYGDKFIILTTYQSAYKIPKCTFDIKILDEIQNINTTKQSAILNIQSYKQLALSGTTNGNCKYGPIIESRNLLYAIKNNIVADYTIDIITAKQDIHIHSVNVTLDNIANKSIHHALIYVNSKINADKVYDCIKLNLFDDRIYYSKYVSGMKKANIIEDLKKSAYGILICVNSIVEGFDLPILDCIVFADNVTSNTKIINMISRANRIKNNSKFKILLPVLYDHNKIKAVLSQIRLEDNTVDSKVSYY